MIFLVFTRILFFLIIVEIFVEMMQNLGSCHKDVQMVEMCKCGRFIYYRIFSWLWELHFLVI